MESVARPVPNDEFGTELVRDWAPQGDPRAIFVLVHGLAEHSGRYERTGSLLSDAGIHVRSYDLIGGGASGGARWDIDDWSRYHDQLQTHMEWARNQGKPLVLMGHSMGGTIALGYVESERPAPDLMVLSAPGLGGGAAWQRALAPVVAAIAPKLVMPNGLNGDQLSRDPAVGEAYFADPLVIPKSTARLGAALFRAMEETAASADQVNVPTLVFHGGQDTIVPPQSTAFLGELPGFERRLYPTLRHETMNEPEGPEVVADVIAWINEHI